MNKKNFDGKKTLVFTLAVLLLTGLVFGAGEAFSQTDPASSDGRGIGDVKPPVYPKKEPSVFIWQYPDKAFWLLIRDDQKAIQCRIGQDGKVFKSLGTMDDNNRVEWDSIWNPTQLYLREKGILMAENEETFLLKRVETISDERCRLSFENFTAGEKSDPKNTSKPVGLPETLAEAEFNPSLSFNYLPLPNDDYGVGTGQGGGIGTGQGNGIGSGTGSGAGSGESVSGKTPPPKNSDIKTARQPLKLISKPRPLYTQAARENNTEGEVILRVNFLANGQIGAITVVKGLPDGLTEKAIQAAKGIRFEPEIRNSQYISVSKLVKFNFVLF